MWHGGDVTRELAGDHRDAARLLAELRDLPPADPGRRERADRLGILLAEHLTAEAAYFYPAVREALRDGGVPAGRALEQQRELERLLRELTALPGDAEPAEPLLSALAAALREHVDLVEGLFRPLRVAVDAERLGFLGDKVRLAKNRAPTRARPEASHDPLAVKFLSPARRALDRFRDKRTGRDRHR